MWRDIARHEEAALTHEEMAGYWEEQGAAELAALANVALASQLQHAAPALNLARCLR